jgi:hypothetical protein
MMRRWWYGLRQWIEDGGFPVVLVRLPIQRRGDDLHAAVAHLRRALRDIRDRTARLHQRWQAVAMAGMGLCDNTALVLVRHPGVARQEITAVLRRRWPTIDATNVGSTEPSWAMSIEDVVDLARLRRGVEPLRIVVLPQRRSFAPNSARADTIGACNSEPMPWTF